MTEVTEIIVKPNGDLVEKITSERVIDRAELRAEKKLIQEELNMKEPSKEELISLGKTFHFFYNRELDKLTKRLDEINILLGK